ncbi:hypothetical protein FE782_03755 [Paenibacillus antri]|uniref:YqbQ/XkdQ domain-containing protein n=1 Tax=Paenibacillus antri TaxID=2582848 RepID=A0A5R9GAC4_9BACL|nr:hypothetical protein [Paenibacillus antri]TLS53397.1 hypothetical protein FE782_03755 [Paenibacillus antri]
MRNVSVVYNGLTVDPIVQSVTWSGEVHAAARRVDIAISNTIDGDTQAIPFEVGRELTVLYDGTEIFRGVIFETFIDINGQATVRAYDENIYLTKNTDSKAFVKVTASEIIRKLCVDFGIPVGTIADTGYVIPRLLFRDQTLWEMMTIALTDSRKQNGRRFYLYSRNGLLNLTERKDMAVKGTIEAGYNILGASYIQSIEDTRTSVKIIGGNDEAPIVATQEDPEMKSLFGTMQHLEYVDGDATKSQVEQLAKQRLKDLAVIDDEASVDALGNIDVVAGAAVYVREPMTGIVGAYYVSADVHTFEGGVHRMNLTLTATDDLPTLE